MSQIKITVPIQPKQAKLYRLVDSPGATWIGYGGSRGGAKSYGIDAVMLLRRMKYPGTVGCILRRTLGLVRENHIDPMLSFWPILSKWYNTTFNEITLPNGSKIAFRSAETAGDVKAMIGKQYMDMVIDQAEEFSEDEHMLMKSCNRWPRLRMGVKPKYVLAFNPGGAGAQFLKRIFVDKDYRNSEMKDDYAFIQAHGWDNVEWARPELEERMTEIWKYYRWWNEDQRFEFFINNTAYGRDLNAKPKALRLAWLMGSFEKFPGQYYDIWNPDRHVARVPPLPYGSIWLGIDWAFAHNAACLWLSQIDKRKTTVFREHVISGQSPRALAQQICDKTTSDEKKRLKAIYLSWETFGRRDERDTIAMQMGQVFRQNGLPWPTQSTKDTGDKNGHYGGPTLIYDMLKNGELFIDPSCEELIKVMPMVTRSEKNPEATVTFDGDDPFDALVYGTKDRLSPAKKPVEDEVYEKAQTIDNPLARHYFLIRKALEGGKLNTFQQSIPSPWGGAY